MVTWRDGSQKLMAVVIERRPSNYWEIRKKAKSRVASGTTSEVKRNLADEKPSSNLKNCGFSSCLGLKADQIHYYIHYVDCDRLVFRLEPMIVLLFFHIKAQYVSMVNFCFFMKIQEVR